MSRWNDKAEQIAIALRAMTELADIEVMVNRTEDLIEQVGELAGKAAGNGCVIVKWLGGQNPDRKSSKLRLSSRFSISLWCMKSVYAGAPPDDLAEGMGEVLQGWVDPRPGQMILRLEVESILLVPVSNDFLVIEIATEVARV